MAEINIKMNIDFETVVWSSIIRCVLYDISYFPKILKVDTKLSGIREKRDFEYRKRNIRAVHMQIFGYDLRFVPLFTSPRFNFGWHKGTNTVTPALGAHFAAACYRCPSVILWCLL